MKTERLEIHKDIYDKLDSYYTNNQIPNIVFHGASGTGKKTIVNDFIDKIYKKDRTLIKTNVMFVNCSHGKGIKFIRDELKFFAKANLETSVNVYFKTIVLLNADHLTNDAQSALRRCIELFTNTTRFFMIVENKHKLLNPILSRFCEIYVSEYLRGDKLINLNQVYLNSVIDIKPVTDTKTKYICEMLNQLTLDMENETTNDQINIMEYCENIYNNGYSCLDIIDRVKMSRDFDALQKSTIEVLYLKLKPEFRCEKMILFSVLNFIYKREIDDIHKIKIM
jgi:replication-associated recombination protein RarA